MNLKFEPMKFHFNSAGAMAEIEEAISIALDELSYQFQQIFIEEIYANGNGSHIMKDEAVRHVKEISRKNDGGIIELEVGVDENISGERERIRTVVVLHGNLNSGPLFTKPGKPTWRKHVAYRDLSRARTVYHLDNFMQLDISGKLLANAEKKVMRHCNEFLRAVKANVKDIDFSQYLVGG